MRPVKPTGGDPQEIFEEKKEGEQRRSPLCLEAKIFREDFGRCVWKVQ
jgi:hypothetical protein